MDRLDPEQNRIKADRYDEDGNAVTWDSKLFDPRRIEREGQFDQDAYYDGAEE